MSVREAALHTSAASVPKDDSVRVVAFQTFTGIEIASEEDAARICALVLLFTFPVSAVIAAPSELDAVVTRLSVLAFTSATIDDEAF